MGFNSESAKRALQVKAGKASYRAKVALLGIEYFQNRGRELTRIRLAKAQQNRDKKGQSDQVSDQSVSVTSVSPDNEPVTDK